MMVNFQVTEDWWWDRKINLNVWKGIICVNQTRPTVNVNIQQQWFKVENLQKRITAHHQFTIRFQIKQWGQLVSNKRLKLLAVPTYLQSHEKSKVLILDFRNMHLFNKNYPKPWNASLTVQEWDEVMFIPFELRLNRSFPTIKYKN